MAPLSQWPLLQLLPLCWGVGRLLLALLPGGEPGGGRPGERLLVLATSFGLGWLALEAQIELLGLLGWTPNLWVLGLPWVGLALIRQWTLPGRIAPRHAISHDPQGMAERALMGAGMLLLLFTVALRARVDQGTEFSGEAAHVLLEGAALIMTLGILRILRTAGWLRGAVLLGGTLVIMVHEHDPIGTARADLIFASAAGLLGALGWARRADRRSRLLCSLLALLLCAQGLAGCCMALAICGSLLAGTAPVRRGATLKEVAPACGLALWILVKEFNPEGETQLLWGLGLTAASSAILAGIRANYQTNRPGRMGKTEAFALGTQPTILFLLAAFLPMTDPLHPLLLLPACLGLIAGLVGPLEQAAQQDPYPSVNGVRAP